MIKAWPAIVACVLLSGCSKDVGSEDRNSQLVPSVGQSGQEGSCLQQPVSELAFDAERVFARALGSYETRLRWNDAERVARRASFAIEASGETHETLRCGGSAFMDVNVHMQVPEAGVDIVFEAVAQAWGQGDEVMISTTLDGDFRSTLRTHADDLARDWSGYRGSPAATRYYFDLWVYGGAISGKLTAQRDKEFCGMAVWPETYCDTHRIAVSADRAPADFDLDAALAAMQAMGDQPLTWSDGTTTQLQFEVQPAAGDYCVGAYLARTDEDITDGTAIEVPAQIHVTTADARFDARIPGLVAAVVSRAHGFEDRVWLEGGFVGPVAALEAAGVRVPLGGADALNVNISANHSGMHQGSLIVTALRSTPTHAVPEKLEPSWQTQPLICSGGGWQVGEQLQGVFGQAR